MYRKRPWRPQAIFGSLWKPLEAYGKPQEASGSLRKLQGASAKPLGASQPLRIQKNLRKNTKNLKNQSCGSLGQAFGILSTTQNTKKP